MIEFTLSETAAQAEKQIRENRLMNLPVPWHDEIIYPHYKGFSIYNLSQSLLQLLGLEVQSPLDDLIWGGASASPVGQVARVVVFLTDGLGYKLLLAMAEEEAPLREDIHYLTDGRGCVPLTSTLPSTTVVALPTLWTAATPAAHGMLGTMMFLRELALLGNLLHFSPAVGKHRLGALEDWGLPSETFVPVQSLGERLSEKGIQTHLLLDYKLMGSGLSKIMHRGVGSYHPHMGTSDLWLRFEDVLKQTRGQKGLVHAYWPVVDTLSHAYGAGSAYVKNEIRQQMRELRRLMQDEAVQDGNTLFIICADHGHYDVPENIDLTQPAHQSLSAALRLPFSGDKRFAQLFLRQDRTQQLINTLSQDYLDQIAWIEPRAAVAAGLFGEGPHHPELPYRLGDLILTLRLGSRLVDDLRSPNSVSIHSGMSDWEMLVPLMWKVI